AYAYTPQDPGLFIVAAALEQEKTRPALEEILAVLFRCKHTLVSPTELARARTNFESDFIYRRETVQGQARQFGYFLTVFSDPDYEHRYLEGLAKVTREDLQRVAQRYFTTDSLSLVLLGATAGVSAPTATEVQALCDRIDNAPATQELSPLLLRKNNDHVSLTTLDNGVRLLVKKHHAIPVMSLQAVMLGGLLFENESNSGINNLLAGLLTRGSEQFSRLALAEAVESLAGSLHGFSGRNSLGLSGAFLTTPDSDEALDLFLETLLHPVFPADEVEKRRREILLALKNREDDLAQIAFDLFYATLFTVHPYRFSILGNEESVHTLQREQMVAYYRTLLNPAQLVISVVGDVDTARVVERLRAALEQLPPTLTVPPLPPTEPRPASIRQQHRTVDKQQAHIVLGYQGVSLAQPERYSLKVLEAILSRQGGRLFYELREQRALAYSVSAFNVEGVTPGVCGVYLGTDPSKVEEATAAARSELARAHEEPVSPAELEQAKKYLTGAYEISLQSNSAQAEQMAFNELYGLGYDNGRRYLAAINAVTAEDLRRVAQAYFDDNAHTLVIVGR
ncbi:MAG: M16 family metallopeptidase, partial [Candidatus Binatia bacterium]